MAKGLFVTGTDTEVGKTVIGAGLLAGLNARGYRTAGMKPVASGAVSGEEGLRNEDAEALRAAASLERPYELVNPYVFVPPIAPHLAAAQIGTTIVLDKIEADFHRLSLGADWVVVEGVGGWKVPLNDQHTTADLARRLGLPVVLVVAIRLGCINHALLSAESIAAAGLPLAGWVANCRRPDIAERDVIEALKARLDGPLLGTVPILPIVAPDAVARCLELDAVTNL